MLSKMKTNRCREAQFAAICVAKRRLCVYVCTHHTHVVFVYSENIFGWINKKLVIVVVSGERNERMRTDLIF